MGRIIRAWLRASTAKRACEGPLHPRPVAYRAPNRAGRSAEPDRKARGPPAVAAPGADRPEGEDRHATAIHRVRRGPGRARHVGVVRDAGLGRAAHLRATALHGHAAVRGGIAGADGKAPRGRQHRLVQRPDRPDRRDGADAVLGHGREEMGARRHADDVPGAERGGLSARQPAGPAGGRLLRPGVPERLHAVPPLGRLERVAAHALRRRRRLLQHRGNLFSTPVLMHLDGSHSGTVQLTLDQAYPAEPTVPPGGTASRGTTPTPRTWCT